MQHSFSHILGKWLSIYCIAVFSLVAPHAVAYDVGGTPDPTMIDSDNDGIPDQYDNCPNDPTTNVFVRIGLREAH